MAAAAPSSEPKPDDPAAEQEDLDKAMQDDWDRMQEGLRERRAASGRATSQEDEDDDELDEDDPLFAHRCAATRPPSRLAPDPHRAPPPRTLPGDGA